jgi:hypothetical protein
LSLSFFSLSFVLALAGMYNTMLALRFRGGAHGERVPWGLAVSGSLFLGGLATFAYILAG